MCNRRLSLVESSKVINITNVEIFLKKKTVERMEGGFRSLYVFLFHQCIFRKREFFWNYLFTVLLDSINIEEKSVLKNNIIERIKRIMLQLMET